jgi:hypothetical protein
MSVYLSTVRPLLFRLDAEHAHRLAIRAGTAAGFAAKALRANTRSMRQAWPRRSPG